MSGSTGPGVCFVHLVVSVTKNKTKCDQFANIHVGGKRKEKFEVDESANCKSSIKKAFGPGIALTSSLNATLMWSKVVAEHLSDNISSFSGLRDRLVSDSLSFFLPNFYTRSPESARKDLRQHPPRQKTGVLPVLPLPEFP